VIRAALPDASGYQRGLLIASQLDLGSTASQTQTMSHVYIRLDFGTDEEKAQLARHKLDGWKQAFRLDKKLLYKLDRPGSPAGEPGATLEAAEDPAPSSSKAKRKPKDKPSESVKEKSKSAADGNVGLLVRLYFSSHEKLSEQRWIARIPSEEPFKSASPRVIQQSDPEFEKADQQFESLD